MVFSGFWVLNSLKTNAIFFWFNVLGGDTPFLQEEGGWEGFMTFKITIFIFLISKLFEANV